MERLVTLRVPERTYVLLEEEAKVQGTEPGQMILKWIDEIVRQEPIYSTVQSAKPLDPLRALFGTLECDIVGVAENHARYR